MKSTVILIIDTRPKR